MSQFQPIRMLEIELGEPIPRVEAVDASSGRKWGKAIALVRLHTHPMGLVDLTLGDDGISADECARQIWIALGEKIVAHLRADGLDEAAELGEGGLPPQATPKCIRDREELLADAPFITVTIGTRNRADVLQRAIRSILALEYPHFELIVVDNAPSTDATKKLVGQEFGSSPRVRYVREDRPGLSHARNRAVEEARGEIVAFTDDDVVVDRHWLAGIAAGFKRIPHAGCVTGLVVPMELETETQMWFEEWGGFGKGCEGRVYDMGVYRPKDRMFPYAAGKYGTGANMAFRTSAVREMGWFDPWLGGGEDIAAFIQVLRKGYAIVYEPGAIVHHQHRRDYAALRRQIVNAGLGFSSVMTKCVIDDPGSILEFASKLPFGVAYALSPRSGKNRKKSASYPKELTRIELQNMLIGPFDYLRALWRRRQQARRSEANASSRARAGSIS